MRISDILAEERVMPHLVAESRDDALRQIVDHLVSHSSAELDREKILRLLVQRERAGSTGIGHSIAIPHAKVPGLEQPVGCFARAPDGVDFSSLDGQPAHLIMTLLAPEGRASQHLKALARASRLFQSAEFRQKLRQTAESRAIWETILEHDRTLAS
ncbi:MAG: PTS sugar transporter subunit IIA [Myxococcales bacterium]|nr:PTS sugar transporter subunit IIA [Myxococcales bacterium]